MAGRARGKARVPGSETTLRNHQKSNQTGGGCRSRWGEQILHLAGVGVGRERPRASSEAAASWRPRAMAIGASRRGRVGGVDMGEGGETLVAAASELANGRPEQHQRHLRKRGIDLRPSGSRVPCVCEDRERERRVEGRGAGWSGQLGQARLGRSSQTWWSSPARLNWV
jgi:hypothetical protein